MIVILIMDIGNLNHPITVILPFLNSIVLWGGALILFIAAIRNKKGFQVKRQTIIALVMVTFALVMFPVIRAINTSISGESYIYESIVELN